MTNSIKMMKSINGYLYKRLYEGLPPKVAGPVSMISMLAISVGLAAAPAHAQDITVPDMIAPVQPMQVPPVISPQHEPTAPSASNPAAAKTATTPPVTQSRADELASKGGFDAETVAPEALAQIEREQQARKAAAATAAAAPVKASRSRANGSSASNISADSNADSMIASDAPAAAPTFEAETAAGTVAAIPAVQPAPEVVSPPNSLSGETGADFGLLAALAALLGVGGAGAYAAARRRKGKGQAAPVVPPVVHGNDPLPASLNAAIMPELRRNQVEPEARPMVDTDQTAVQTLESKATTKADFAQFVANLPSFDKPLGKADRSVSLGQRRVAAAPRPYLAEADLSRTAGYFTANVDAMPTPQNPFLTRQKRLKRARFLDGKLASTKAPTRKSPTRVTGEMQVSRPLEPAFS